MTQTASRLRSGRTGFATLARSLLLAVCLLLASISYSDSHVALASSTRDNPLRRIGYATDTTLEVVSKRTSVPRDEIIALHSESDSAGKARNNPVQARHTRRDGWQPLPEVRADDSIRIHLRAFNQSFFLHLDPNDDIVPPQGASLSVWKWDAASKQDVLVRKETLPREQVRAYHGVVVHPSLTARRLYEDELGVSRLRSGLGEEQGVVGRASIFLHDDGSASGVPRFEGAFDWHGNTHTIQRASVYDRARQPQDPRPHRRSLDEDHLIVHRNSDLMGHEEMVARGLGQASGLNSSCAHDAQDFNRNNPLFTSDANNFNTSRSPLDFFIQDDADAVSSLGLFRRSLDWWSGSEVGQDSWDDDEVAGAGGAASFYYEPDWHAANLQRRQTAGDALGNGGNSSFTSSIGSTTGCPNSAQVVYVGMAADCTFTQVYDGNTGATAAALLNIMNDVSSVYRSTFNVSLGVVALDVRESECPASGQSGDASWNTDCSSASIDQRLSRFSQWRGAQPANDTGIWELLTACSTGSEVGVAWLGTLCNTEVTSSGSDSVSGAAVIANGARVSQVVAHETGHVFGAVHDCAEGCSISGSNAQQAGGAACCPRSTSTCNDNADHIMSPVAQKATMVFSPCSVGNICTMLGGLLDTSCVETPGQRSTLSVQQCGNGILETAAGEECDAGPEGSACCTTECKLVSGAVCDPTSSACCESTCQFSPASKMCRPAKDGSDCDEAEYCSGTAAECPADDFRDNGASCSLPNSSASGLTCANGRCTSRDLQCREQTNDDEKFRKACSTSAVQDCSMACQDPDSAFQCTVFQTNFIDGSKCGYGGTCQAGKCKSSGWQNVFKDWYRNNLQIAVPVTVVVGLLALAILYGILRCLCCGGRRGRRGGAPSQAAWAKRGSPAQAQGPQPGWTYEDTSPGSGSMGMNEVRHGGGAADYGAGGGAGYGAGAAPGGWAAPSYPPPPSHPDARAARGQSQGWVDPAAWNGPAVR